jgi:hypothetical protein
MCSTPRLRRGASGAARLLEAASTPLPQPFSQTNLVLTVLKSTVLAVCIHTKHVTK